MRGEVTPDETVLRTREDVMRLLDADEEGMRLAKREREEYVLAWHRAEASRNRVRTDRA